eukprot:CAMPEP_0185768676 /NCGR_PEP_ID=MMETSP1174-20130828/51413_1 /TAXON_ID=35687 /ORGANISM="Dictyocha speculum, Strain CCMP1381" /LENGTH=124 /DNA_ID=CAMNT_0028453481 /DNA_START=35 /DNA_END=409 /DNA_ORIENTATION=+
MTSGLLVAALIQNINATQQSRVSGRANHWNQQKLVYLNQSRQHSDSSHEAPPPRHQTHQAPINLQSIVPQIVRETRTRSSFSGSRRSKNARFMSIGRPSVRKGFKSYSSNSRLESKRMPSKRMM